MTVSLKFFAAARIKVGPPISMVSIPGFSINGYKLTTTIPNGSIP